MPKNPTIEQRIAWHLEHEKQCGCRKMPPKLRELIDAKAGKRGAGRK